MNNTTPIETEVKFLIKIPKISDLLSQKDISIKEITQTYLLSSGNSTKRVRKVSSNGKTRFILTEKTRISDLSAYENEMEISFDDYNSFLKNADTSRISIEKTRYSFPLDSHIVEIDIYPFWNDRAILEIELSDESEEYSIPSFISVTVIPCKKEACCFTALFIIPP